MKVQIRRDCWCWGRRLFSANESCPL